MPVLLRQRPPPRLPRGLGLAGNKRRALPLCSTVAPTTRRQRFVFVPTPVDRPVLLRLTVALRRSSAGISVQQAWLLRGHLARASFCVPSARASACSTAPTRIAPAAILHTGPVWCRRRQRRRRGHTSDQAKPSQAPGSTMAEQVQPAVHMPTTTSRPTLLSGAELVLMIYY